MKVPPPETSFPILLQQFFLERLIQQRNASAQTVAAYRDSFRLLLQFAQSRLGKAPERLALSDLDTPLILAFLNHLESDRHNTIRSRNARFAAIRFPLHALAGNSFSSPRIAVNLVDLALQYKGGKRPVRFERCHQTLRRLAFLLNRWTRP
jgi:hypothetical protein